MAEPPAPNRAAAFPTPPQFWQQFTPENLDRIEGLRAVKAGAEAKSFEPATSLPIRLLDLPAELRFFQPPEPPADGVYKCFGDIYTLTDPLPTLGSQGVQQLYTSPSTPGGPLDGKHSDRALVLKRLAKSLLLNFLELLGIMSVNPEQFAEKIEDIRTLFINFHHLLNEYRPHQARESLILMMQGELDRSEAETEGIMDMKKRVEEILKRLGNMQLAEGDQAVRADSLVDGKGVVEEGRSVWEELEAEFG